MSYDTVKTHVRSLKKHRARLAFIRFETEPGHQGQVDWGDFKVIEPDGTETTLHLFALVFSYSRVL